MQLCEGRVSIGDDGHRSGGSLCPPTGFISLLFLEDAFCGLRRHPALVDSEPEVSESCLVPPLGKGRGWAWRREIWGLGGVGVGNPCRLWGGLMAGPGRSVGPVVSGLTKQDPKGSLDSTKGLLGPGR